MAGGKKDSGKNVIDPEEGDGQKVEGDLGSRVQLDGSDDAIGQMRVGAVDAGVAKTLGEEAGDVRREVGGVLEDQVDPGVVSVLGQEAGGVRKGVSDVLEEPLNPRQLVERLEVIKTLADVKAFLPTYLMAWKESPAAKTMMKICGEDSDAFVSRVLTDVSRELEAGGEPSSARLYDFLEEFRGMIIGENSVFGCEFPLEVTDENLSGLRRMVTELDMGMKAGDVFGKPLIEKMMVLKNLCDKTDGGVAFDKYIEGVNFGIFDRMYEGYHPPRQLVVEFYLALDENGRRNLVFLDEFEAVFYPAEVHARAINSLDEGFIKSLLPLKTAGIEIVHLDVSRFVEFQGRVSPATIEAFCAIYGGSDHQILSFREIVDFEGVKFTPNGIRAMRILHRAIAYFEWRKMIEGLNGLTDYGVEALELFVDDFLAYHNYDEDRRFVLLNGVDAERLLFLKSLKKVKFPRDFGLFYLLNDLSGFDGLRPLSDEEVQVMDFVVEFIDRVDNYAGFFRLKDLLPLVRRVQNSGISLAELRSMIERVDGPALRMKLGKARAPMKIVDAILFAYGARESALELYESGLIKPWTFESRSCNQNVQKIAPSLGSGGDALRAILYCPTDSGDFDLNNILEVGPDNCARCVRLAKLFPQARFKGDIPRFAYELTDEELTVLERRLAKLGVVTDISLEMDFAVVERFVKVILEADDLVFDNVPFLYSKVVGWNIDDRLVTAVNLAKRFTAEDSGELAVLRRLAVYFPKCSLVEGGPSFVDVTEDQWRRLESRFARVASVSDLRRISLSDLNNLTDIKLLLTMDDDSFEGTIFVVLRISAQVVESHRFNVAMRIVTESLEGQSGSTSLEIMKRLAEYFPFYEIPADFKLADFTTDWHVDWDKLRVKVGQAGYLRDFKDLRAIKKIIDMDDEVFEEFCFFFPKASPGGGLTQGFDVAISLAVLYASEGGSRAGELATLRRLEKYFKYQVDRGVPEFGEIAEAEWGRLERRLADHPELGRLRNLSSIKGIIEIEDDLFEDMIYLFNRKWGFGDPDLWENMATNFVHERKGRKYLEEIAEIAEKAVDRQEFDLRTGALRLFGKNPQRMAVFERLLPKFGAGQGLIDAHDLYWEDERAFELIAYVLEFFGVPYVGQYKGGLSAIRRLKGEDDPEIDEKRELEKFVKEAFFRNGQNFTVDGLEEFLRLFPEYDFFEELNEHNLPFLIFVYARMNDGGHHGEEFEQLMVGVNKLLAANRDFALRVFNDTRDRVLAGQLDYVEGSMVRRIVDFGVQNYKILERVCQFVAMTLDREKINSDADAKAASVSLLSKFASKEKGSRRINYSNEEYVSFYEKCLGVHKDTLHGLLQCFDALQPDGGNFALMQEEVMGSFVVINALIGDQGLSGELSFRVQKLSDKLRGLAGDLGESGGDVDKERAMLSAFIEELHVLIKDIFQIMLGLRNLPELTPEKLEQVKYYLIYLANIHDSNNERKAIIALFVLLKILGKWEEFKRGEEVDVSLYLSDQLKGLVEPYMRERKSLDIFESGTGLSQALVIDESGRSRWMEVLTDKSEVILVGESRGVLDVMQQIEKNYKALEDPDNFTEMEKVLFGVVKKHGASNVAKTLAQRFRNPSLQDQVIADLDLARWGDEKQVLPVMQKTARIFGNLQGFVAIVAEVNIPEKVRILEAALKPDVEVVDIFKKIGEEMTTTSGAKPVNEDIEHLESILHKKREELTAEESVKAQLYIDKVKLEVLALNRVQEDVAGKFMALHEACKKIELGSVFQSRMEEFRKVFLVKDSASKITLKSTMTGDLADVIPHIRQCLGCTSQECNNDTNLVFGDRNRFSVLTREFGMPESRTISDELVTAQVTSEVDGARKEEDSSASGNEGGGGNEARQKTYSFVMDNVYGQRTKDILVCNVLAVFGKLKKLKRLSPDTAMDVFVTDAALTSCGLTEDYLGAKLREEAGSVNLQRVVKNVSIARSASGDGHYEIGGGFHGRVESGEGEVGGVKLWI